MRFPRILPTALLGVALVVAGCDRGTDLPAEAPLTASPDAAAPDPAPDASDTPEKAPPTAEATDAPTDAPATVGTVNYVALGDSLATGAGATTSYVEEYADALRSDTGADVELTNFAVNGWTSTDLLESLRDDTGVRMALADADLVTLDIGANDLLRALPAYANEACGGDDNLQCLRAATDTFADNWAAILDEIVALRDGEAAGIVTMDLYQPFVDNDRLAGDLDQLRPVLEAINTAITEGAAAHGIPVAAVHTAFHGADGTDDPTEAFLISVDGLHPSNAGHQRIAEELLALEVPLPPTA